MITGLDAAVIGLVLLSGLFAMVRGLTREVLAILAWLGAAYIAWRCFPYLQPLARAHIAPPWVADLTAGAGVFVILLIVLSVVSHQMSERVRGSPAGALDRSLGLIFGLARGMLIACVLFALVKHTIFRETEPDWLREARVTPALRQGADYLVSLLPKARLHRIEPGPVPTAPLPPPAAPGGQKAAARNPESENQEWRSAGPSTMYAPVAANPAPIDRAEVAR